MRREVLAARFGRDDSLELAMNPSTLKERALVKRTT
jgi:hypothetical protein